MSIINRLESHFNQYQVRQDNDAGALGLGRWVYPFPHQQFEAETKALVNEISQNVNKFESPEQKEKIRRLFFNVVPSLESQEEKKAIYQTVAGNKTLQNLLDKNVGRYRCEKGANLQLVHDPDHKLNRRIAKARLALNLGYRGESAGTGMSGATFLRSITGKRLGLFKVSNDHQSLWKTLHDGVLRHVLFNQPYYLSPTTKAGVQAEEAAYIVSSKGGFGKLVPPTKLTQFGGIDGSFQLMAPMEKGEELTEFANIIDRFEDKEQYSQNEIQMFQKFAIYDYLIGNLDRHHGNWLVEYSEKNGEVQLDRIHAIDHDRAFIEKNPSSYLGLKSHYKWRNLKIAREQMTEETKQFIQDHLQEGQVSQMLASVEENIANFMTPEMKVRLQEKASVLRKIANSNEGTLQELGDLRTDKEIQDFLTNLNV